MPEGNITPTPNVLTAALAGHVLIVAKPAGSGAALVAEALPAANSYAGMIQPGHGVGATFLTRTPYETSHPLTGGGAGS